MLDHISVTATDLKRAKAFYDAALAPLGIEVLWGDDESLVAVLALLTAIFLIYRIVWTAWRERRQVQDGAQPA